MTTISNFVDPTKQFKVMQVMTRLRYGYYTTRLLMPVSTQVNHNETCRTRRQCQHGMWRWTMRKQIP